MTDKDDEKPLEATEIQLPLQGRRTCGNEACYGDGVAAFHIMITRSEANQTTTACSSCIWAFREDLKTTEFIEHPIGADCEMPGTAWLTPHDGGITRCIVGEG